MSVEIIIISLIAIAAILGGSVNYFSNPKDDQGFQSWLKSVVVAFVAALLIPLFLSTISSDLLQKVLSYSSPTYSSDLFVFFGFCIIGAISSRAFIQSLSEKILKTAKEATRKAEEAKDEVREVQKEVDTLIEQSTEKDDLPSDDLLLEGLLRKIDKDEISVLKALIHPKFTRRSIKGISESTSLPREKVSEILKSLISSGLAIETSRNKGIRWAITADGKSFVEHIEKEEKKSKSSHQDQPHV